MTSATGDPSELPPNEVNQEPISTSPTEKVTDISTKKKGRQSIMWDHFTKIIKNGKEDGAKCNYCNGVFKWVSANGTSVLKKHNNSCPKYNLQGKKQKTLSFQSGTQNEGSNLNVWSFDQELCRQALTRMVIIDELPFNHVQKEGFRHYSSVLQPNFKIVSRTTVARDCLTLYATMKKKLKDCVSNPNQRICLTTDSWTSLQNLSYMCLTTHFIDSDWKLHKRVLNFCVISSHKGEAIGRAVEDCLKEWGIEKLGTLTVDNASSNDVVVAYLKRKLFKKSDSLMLGGEFFHVRCCAHILNLIVKDGLSEMKDSLNRIRSAVKFVKSSPQREQKFKECAIKEEIASKSFLCLDVPTRWNSTYLMLVAALKFQKAFERLEDEESQFILELKDEPPNASDWDDARFFVQFLKKFYDATVRLSGSLYITSNMYFHEVSGIETNLVESLESLDPFVSAMAKKMKSKFDKYWGKIEKLNIMVFIAIVLDPRCKLKYLRYRFSKVYEPTLTTELMKKITETINRLFDEYQKKELVTSSQNQTQTLVLNEMMEDDQHQQGNASDLIALSDFEKHLEQEESDIGKSELDKYLEESCEKNCPKFEILNWWKVNSPRFTIISQIARDVLAIPVSTVASESTFSTGGRVLDQFRSSLGPKLVECLICTQDWLRSTPLPVQVEETMAELEALESEVSAITTV